MSCTCSPEIQKLGAGHSTDCALHWPPEHPGPRLTPREVETLAFIEEFIDDNGWAPTVREIGAGLGLGSTSSVYDLLEALERKDRIRRGKGPSQSRSRAIRLHWPRDTDAV